MYKDIKIRALDFADCDLSKFSEFWVMQLTQSVRLESYKDFSSLYEQGDGDSWNAILNCSLTRISASAVDEDRKFVFERLLVVVNSRTADNTDSVSHLWTEFLERKKIGINCNQILYYTVKIILCLVKWQWGIISILKP